MMIEIYGDKVVGSACILYYLFDNHRLFI